MQIITLSIIYRELCAYTVLYRASNTEDKDSEWENVNKGTSRGITWLGGRGRNEMCLQTAKEGKGEILWLGHSWKLNRRTGMDPMQTWDHSTSLFSSFHSPLRLNCKWGSRLCFYLIFYSDLCTIKDTMSKVNRKTHTEMQYFNVPSSPWGLSGIYKNPKGQ